MFTSNEQISPPSLVLNCKVAKFCIKECPKAVNLKEYPRTKSANAENIPRKRGLVVKFARLT